MWPRSWPNATVILFRAPVVNGTIGTFTQVNQITSTAGGTVAIADTNSGQGAIPDGSYVYEAQQVDLAGNASPVTAPSMTITIDTAIPSAPSAVLLDPNSDTGVSNSDGITRITLSAFPTFDISGVEGLATSRVVPGRAERHYACPGREPGCTTELDAAHGADRRYQLTDA